MPAISSLQIGTILKRHMQKERLSQGDIAELLELSVPTIGRFLQGKSNPHKETMEKIEDWLKNEGVLTRLGLPTEIPAVPSPEDTKQLADMGIVSPSQPKHYVCCYLQDFDFAIIVQGIMNSAADEATKRRILGALFQQEFPTLG